MESVQPYAFVDTTYIVQGVAASIGQFLQAGARENETELRFRERGMWRTHVAQSFDKNMDAAKQTLQELMEQLPVLNTEILEQSCQKMHIFLGDLLHDFNRSMDAADQTSINSDCSISRLIAQASESLRMEFTVDPSCRNAELVVKNYKYNNPKTTHHLALISILQILENAKKRLPEGTTGKNIKIKCEVILQAGAGGRTLRWAKLYVSNPIDPDLRLSMDKIPSVGRRAIYKPKRVDSPTLPTGLLQDYEVHTGALMVGAIARGDLDGDFYVSEYNYEIGQITVALELPIIDEAKNAPNI